jgi:hypothetical protein
MNEQTGLGSETVPIMNSCLAGIPPACFFPGVAFLGIATNHPAAAEAEKGAIAADHGGHFNERWTRNTKKGRHLAGGHPRGLHPR